MKKYAFSVDFEAHEDWKPLNTACWFHCPFSSLTKLGESCHGLKYKEACPFVQYGIKEIKEVKDF